MKGRILIIEDDKEINQLLSGFFKDDVKIRRRACAAAFICVVFSVPACLLYSGYRTTDYVEDFEKGFAMMKAHYVLAEHKGIDWDALYEKYLPEFEAVKALFDDGEAYILQQALDYLEK